MKYMLRNDKNQEIEITAEQLAAAGVKIVPEGSTVIGTADLTRLTDEIKNLSTRLTASETLAKKTEMATELDRLTKGGFITGAQKEFALSLWGESTDLTAFKAWAATFTTPIIQLGKEHGAGGDVSTVESEGEQATAQLIELSNRIAKEQSIPLREAMSLASKQLGEGLVEKYREQFAEV